jgi:hypothetical protein
MTSSQQRSALHAATFAMTVLVLTGSASAGTKAASSRPPTYREREAITKALPRGIRQTPVECLWLDIRVSSINPRYAEVGGLYLNAHRRGDLCLRYAHNGGLFLKKGARWRVIFEGTTPPCSTLHIPRDLVGMC